jgi:hypothetical protein
MKTLPFAVEEELEGKGGCVEHGSAILALGQVVLDFAADFGCQPSFQVLAD